MENRLYRSRTERVFGGVAGGLANYMNLDPVLIRVIFVLVTLLSGLGVVAYLIMWIVVPEEPYKNTAYYQTPPPGEGSDENNDTYENSGSDGKTETVKKSSNSHIVIGSILIGLGVIFLTKNYCFYFDFMDILPIILIGIGAAIVIRSAKK